MPVGCDSILGVGSVANPAISVHLPAVKRALQPFSLDQAIGKVRTLVRAERLHGGDPALYPAAKQGDLLAQAPDMPDFSRPDFTGCRNPVPAVRIGRRVSAFPVACQAVGHRAGALSGSACGAACSLNFTGRRSASKIGIADFCAAL